MVEGGGDGREKSSGGRRRILLAHRVASSSGESKHKLIPDVTSTPEVELGKEGRMEMGGRAPQEVVLSESA